MSLAHGSQIARDGLVLQLDAANPKSYPGTGTAWNDLSGLNNHFTLDSTGITYSTDNKGCFTLADGGATRLSTITTSAAATCVFWMRTTDTQSLFLSGDPGATGGFYLGAYRVSLKEYYGASGTPQFYMDTVDVPNIYDYIRDDQWHMLEFKNVNFQASPWPQFKFNKYSTFTFGNGAIASLMIYDRTITASESLQNFEALRGRYGV